MTIRLVGVAIGVRKDAAAATATLISTGRGETPMLCAAATPIGMMIRAVAVLLINWPEDAGQHEQPGQQGVGAGIAHHGHQPLRQQPAAPVCSIAVESGIIAPTRITVVQSMAR